MMRPAVLVPGVVGKSGERGSQNFYELQPRVRRTVAHTLGLY